MNACTYCGQENDDTVARCRACGTAFTVDAAPGPPVSRFCRITLGALVAVGFVVVAVTVPYLFWAVPLLVLWYAPIYVPFLLSFAIKSPEWWGLRWSLRVAAIAAFFIRLWGMAHRPSFGNDAPGNIAGATHHFNWTWGSGLGCAAVALILGLLLRLATPSSSRETPDPTTGAVTTAK